MKISPLSDFQHLVLRVFAQNKQVLEFKEGFGLNAFVRLSQELREQEEPPDLVTHSLGEHRDARPASLNQL